MSIFTWAVVLLWGSEVNLWEGGSLLLLRRPPETDHGLGNMCLDFLRHLTGLCCILETKMRTQRKCSFCKCRNCTESFLCTRSYSEGRDALLRVMGRCPGLNLGDGLAARTVKSVLFLNCLKEQKQTNRCALSVRSH